MSMSKGKIKLEAAVGATHWEGQCMEKKKAKGPQRDFILQEKDILLKHDGTAQIVLWLNILG